MAAWPLALVCVLVGLLVMVGGCHFSALTLQTSTEKTAVATGGTEGAETTEEADGLELTPAEAWIADTILDVIGSDE